MEFKNQEITDWSPSGTVFRCDEEAGFLAIDDEQLYYVHHPAVGSKRGSVLLAGPFANERTYSAIVWRRWARYLAERGFDVIRFDYRGVGESSGNFHEKTFSVWMDDIRLCVNMLLESSGGCPVILHGLRLGALLLSHLFNSGTADALLMWEPPKSGSIMLKEALRARLSGDMARGRDGRRLTRDDYIGELDAGSLVCVDGYYWSRALWHDAQKYPLHLPSEQEKRSWRVIQLEKRATLIAQGNTQVIPVPKPAFWKMSALLKPDLSSLFEYSTRWITKRGCNIEAT